MTTETTAFGRVNDDDDDDDSIDDDATMGRSWQPVEPSSRCHRLRRSLDARRSGSFAHPSPHKSRTGSVGA
jgi:hypothetical protein